VKTESVTKLFGELEAGFDVTPSAVFLKAAICAAIFAGRNCDHVVSALAHLKGKSRLLAGLRRLESVYTIAYSVAVPSSLAMAEVTANAHGFADPNSFAVKSFQISLAINGITASNVRESISPTLVSSTVAKDASGTLFIGQFKVPSKPTTTPAEKGLPVLVIVSIFGGCILLICCGGAIFLRSREERFVGKLDYPIIEQAESDAESPDQLEVPAPVKWTMTGLQGLDHELDLGDISFEAAEKVLAMHDTDRSAPWAKEPERPPRWSLPWVKKLPLAGVGESSLEEVEDTHDTERSAPWGKEPERPPRWSLPACPTGAESVVALGPQARRLPACPSEAKTRKIRSVLASPEGDEGKGTAAGNALSPHLSPRRAMMRVATMSPDFQVGEQVERCDIGFKWDTGYVTSMVPLKVTAADDPLSDGYTWDNVRHIRKAAPPPVFWCHES